MKSKPLRQVSVKIRRTKFDNKNFKDVTLNTSLVYQINTETLGCFRFDYAFCQANWACGSTQNDVLLLTQVPNTVANKAVNKI